MMRTFARYTLLALCMSVSVLGVLPPQTASANPGQPGPYGTLLNYGFFKNGKDVSGGNVFPNGMYVNNVDELVARIKFELRKDNPATPGDESAPVQYRRGASFIVQTMRGGADRSYDVDPDGPVFADWEQRVRYVASYGGINFDEPFSFDVNSYYQDALQDDAFYTINTPTGNMVWTPDANYEGQKVGNSIVFRYPNGTVAYAIRKACANPVGWPGELPKPPKDYNLTPSSSVTPPTAEGGQTVSYNHYVTYNGAAPATTKISVWDIEYPSGSAGPPPGAQGCAALGGTNCVKRWEVDAGFGPSRGVAAFNVTIPPGAQVGSLVCQFLLIDKAQADTNGNIVAANRNSAPACVRVAKSPLVYFDRGDVRTGGAFSLVDSACTIGANKIKTSVAGGKGSNVQYGAYAAGAIQGFGSMALPADNADARRLLFANTPTFGGYRSANPCLNDFSTVAASAPTKGAGGPIDINTLPDGIHKFAGDITIAGANNIKKKVTIVATGSVTIAGDLVYSNGSYASVADMPRVVIVANNGNITVNTNVKQIEGIFVAKGSGNSPSSGGVFRTCPAVPVNKDTCPNQLVVNGSVIANAVSFRRTGGDKNSPVRDKQPAEYFVLREDAILGSYGASLNGAEARTVMETELPPRY